ncbi:shikimate kinase [Thalassobacillus sp. CUG 92003]|uniref:shikimate kinase n=1 Tax=Thalassobacillus sp. CUG 92003 TaxID=2736641 RepID=UPI0015E7C5C9|nr:shikimate kinase [Thalassobacillus sp. CUG 92003]
MKTIYLIGFMGAGKSTIASLLGKQMGLPVIELDDYIEKAEGMSIPDIFAARGETGFRDAETEHLASLPAEGYIVSTGGGVVTRQANRDIMDKGVVVFLNVSFETVTQRLQDDQQRPLWRADSSDKYKIFLERQPLYQQMAHITIAVDDQTPSEIVELVAARLG